MNWLVFHVASGQVFFTGVGLVIVAAIASTQSNSIVGRLNVLAFLLGAIAIAISSTPIPYWYYGVAVAVTAFWMASASVMRWRRWSAAAVVVVWAIAAAIEFPYHLPPSLRPASARSLTVIGDSVTAGMGEDDGIETWPRILEREHDLAVQDLSHIGERAGSARKRVADRSIEGAVVLVAIGGNDLLGGTSSPKFAADLDGLLTRICSSDRQVVMLELPLVPFYHEYGRIQRSLARKHKVRLVPKWKFLSVLSPQDATLDTIHLSQQGHQRMAETVWQIVGRAMADMDSP